MSDVSEPAKAPVAWLSEAQDPAKAPVARVSEAQEQVKALMAWMERNARVSEGPVALMSEVKVAEDEIIARRMENH